VGGEFDVFSFKTDGTGNWLEADLSLLTSSATFQIVADEVTRLWERSPKFSVSSFKTDETGNWRLGTLEKKTPARPRAP
jgi:hypothetical protein